MSDAVHRVPLSSQVGGHPGVMASEDGSLIIKPCLPLERDFYQRVAAGTACLERLAPFLPTFYGTLKLEGQVVNKDTSATEGDTQKDIVPASPEEQRDEYAISLVLENLSHAFLKPNIMDIKLGTVLYDQSASPEKKERMIKTAKETTSLETGIRLTGFQVYDYTNSAAVHTPKSYGKSIKPSDLPDGISRFFPLSLLSEDQTPQGQGLPRSILLPILRGILEDVIELRYALEDTEIRMVGASLLVVYEADWAKAREGLKSLEEDRDQDQGDDGDENEDEDKVSDLPYSVRLIDFAHTRLVPRKGPDKGVLLGLETTIKLLERRIVQIEAFAPINSP